MFRYYLARRDEESTPSRDDQYALQTSASVGKKQLFVIKKHKHDEIEEEEEDMLFRKHTRKPLNRSIAAELEHMIAQLRKDPSKRAELEERIGKHYSIPFIYISKRELKQGDFLRLTLKIL